MSNDPSPPRETPERNRMARCAVCDGYIWLGRCADRACHGWGTCGLSAESWARRQHAFGGSGPINIIIDEASVLPPRSWFDGDKPGE